MPKLEDLIDKAPEIEELLSQVGTLTERVTELEALLMELSKDTEPKVFEDKPFLELPHPRMRIPEEHVTQVVWIWVISQARSRKDDDGWTRVSVKQSRHRRGSTILGTTAFDVILLGSPGTYGNTPNCSGAPPLIEPGTTFPAWNNLFTDSKDSYPTLRDQWIGGVPPDRGFWATVVAAGESGQYTYTRVNEYTFEALDPTITGTCYERNNYGFVPDGTVVWIWTAGTHTNFQCSRAMEGTNESDLLIWRAGANCWQVLPGPTGSGSWYLRCVGETVGWYPEYSE